MRWEEGAPKHYISFVSSCGALFSCHHATETSDAVHGNHAEKKKKYINAVLLQAKYISS